jgi:serine/threonine protein kinase
MTAMPTRPLDFDLELPPELFRTRRASIAIRKSARRSTPNGEREPGSGTNGRASEVGLLQSGAILDKYRVEELLGTGGFAAVYRATHLLLHIPVAVKLLRPRVLVRNPGIAEQLLQEARYVARIDHPNVVRIHDVTHTPDITFIVMEYIEGLSLARQLSTAGPMRPADALRIGAEVAEGLRAGLEQGLIHRDVKPANILLPRNGCAKLVDFGLAHAWRSGADFSAFASEPAVGTRGYMAPEQARASGRVDFRADVYALGVTLLQAMTGRSRHERTPLAELLANVPRDAARLVGRMLSEGPEERATSYAELVKELRACAAMSE